jgi:glutamyl-Q tRNA(Asp) synthetase
MACRERKPNASKVSPVTSSSGAGTGWWPTSLQWSLEGITEIVRGIDIMDSTQRQIWLQQLLDYHTPRYVHVPVITHPNGDKFQTVLVAALAALKQGPPTDLTSSSIPDIWLWAVENWKLEPLRGLTAVISENISANSLTGTP